MCPITDEEQEQIARILACCEHITVPAVALGEEHLPIAFGNAFIAKVGGWFFAVTAGHSVRNTHCQWYVEIADRKNQNDQALCIPFKQTWDFQGSIDVSTPSVLLIEDFAVGLLDLSVAADREIPYFAGLLPSEFQFDKDSDAPFTMQGLNDAERFEAPRNWGVHWAIERKIVRETHLGFNGRNESGSLVFRLAHKHPGHGYYKGCSGAPILSDDGTPVAVLIGGDEASDCLFGAPITKFASALSAIAERMSSGEEAER